MKKNITLIGLVNDYKQKVSKALAGELDMIFADVNDLMEFNLINSNMLEKVGQEYYDTNERKTLQTVSSYENTVLTLNFSTLNKNNNIEILKQNSIIIYIRISFNDFCLLNHAEVTKSLAKINEIAFEDRDNLMQKYADIVVENDKIDITNSVNLVMKEIQNYFDKR